MEMTIEEMKFCDVKEIGKSFSYFASC